MAAGFQEVSPALVPARSGGGDAVTGINRAYSANGDSTGAILRQSGSVCKCIGEKGIACSRATRLASLLTVSPADKTDSESPLPAAYPPPRESCLRGADRATVDKRIRRGILVNR